jgi:hypothetical protein
MPVRISTTDTLPHIRYADESAIADNPNSLRNRVSSTDGRLVIVSAFGCSLVLNYSFATNGINVNVTLETPIGSVVILNGELTTTNPSITLGGSIGNFKAEATISFEFETLTLNAQGEICIPLIGCKSGGFSIRL